MAPCYTAFHTTITRFDAPPTRTLQHARLTFIFIRKDVTLVLVSRLEEAERGMGDLCEGCQQLGGQGGALHVTDWLADTVK
jgi:hypothetical protein